MKGISIQLKRLTKKKAVNSSKLFGSPDVWSGFEWPVIADSHNCYDLDFLAQINCADACVFDDSGFFPKTGMLYFFYDFVDCPTDINNKNAARVMYYGGDINSLKELVMVDDEGIDCAITTPQHILFSATGYNTNNAKLQMCYVDKDFEEYIVLLRISSFSALNGDLQFNGIGDLLFLIEENKFKALDFSDVRVAVKYQ